MPTPTAAPTPEPAKVPTPTAQRILEMQEEINKKLDLLLSPNSPAGTTSTADLSLETHQLTLQAVSQIRTLLETLIGFFQSPTNDARLKEILAGQPAK
jgi:hypothetical protein